MACRAARARHKTAAPGGRSPRSSTAALRSARSVAPAGAAAPRRGRSAHSRAATPPHSGVPRRPPVRSGVPKVAMPAEAINRLSAHAAEPGAFGETRFAIRRRRLAEGNRQALVRADPPRPSGGCAALRRERTRETIGADCVGAPIGIGRKPRHRRHPALAQRVDQHRLWKNVGQRSVQALPRPPIVQLPRLRHFHAGDRASKA